MSKLISALSFSVLLVLTSCQNYEEAGYADTSDLGISKFAGSTLEYLQSGDEKLSLKFDSMMKVMNGIPDFKTLFDDGTKHTIFAIPDTCFRKVITTLNLYRKNNSLGKNVYLDDLLVKPFTVKRTIEQEPPFEPIITYRKYDYRAGLDTLLCRYIFDGIYDSERISENEGQMNVESYRYAYPMNVSSGRYSAGGVVGGGSRVFSISDTNNSQLKDNWSTTPVMWQDIYTNDGIVHVLSIGHEFGFDEFVSHFKNRYNELKDENDEIVEE